MAPRRKLDVSAAAAGRDAAPSNLSTDQALTALLALQAAERDDRLNPDGIPRPTEVVLADAGLNYGEVAQMTGKAYEAVKSTIRRSRERAAARSSKAPVLPPSNGAPTDG